MVYHKSGITEIFRTGIVCTIGCLGLLFFFILKNPQENNNYYYLEFYSLLFPVLIITVFLRMLFLRIGISQLKQKKVFFNVLLIGSGKNVIQFYNTFIHTNEITGYCINSYLNINGNNTISLPQDIKIYNDLANIDSIISDNDIEEVIITVEKNERELLVKILQQAFKTYVLDISQD